jgi:prephenate dehydrogenase
MSLPANLLFGKAALLGVGYMGGSLMLAARTAGCVTTVTGFDVDQAAGLPAMGRGVIDSMATNPADAVKGAQLVVLAAPVGSLGALAVAIGPHVEPGALVIDIGSVKSSVIESVRAGLSPATAFVGCHPLAGRESSGVAASDPLMYQGKPCLICTDAAASVDVERALAFWQAVGALPVRAEARAHDAFMAAASHLPHVAAFSLAHALLPQAEELAQAMPAGASPSSLRDTTRIAASAPAVWRDIFLSNRQHLLPLVDALATSLSTLRQAIATNDATALQTFLTNGRAARRTLIGDGTPGES